MKVTDYGVSGGVVGQCAAVAGDDKAYLSGGADKVGTSLVPSTLFVLFTESTGLSADTGYPMPEARMDHACGIAGGTEYVGRASTSLS